jgi:hypothetical protein
MKMAMETGTLVMIVYTCLSDCYFAAVSKAGQIRVVYTAMQRGC